MDEDASQNSEEWDDASHISRSALHVTLTIDYDSSA